MSRKKFLTEAEMARFLKAARETRNGKRDYCLMLMAYRHGLRVSEAVDIRMDEVDLVGSRLFVRRLKKGLSTHQPIEGDELRAIKAWLHERSANRGAEGSPLLFLSTRGPFVRQAINYLCAAIGKRAGLGRVNPHMLRHSCGFALADRNAATRTIQDYLGHRNIQHTVIYTAANARRFRDLWRK